MNDSQQDHPPRPYVEVLMKKVYGNERFYPCSEDAKIICHLLSATTLTRTQLKYCRDSGWHVSIKTEEYSLD